MSEFVHNAITKYSHLLSNTTLEPVQCVIIEYIQKFHNNLIALDTGLGKSYIMIAYCVLDKIMNDGKSKIIVCENTQISDWYNSFKKLTGLNIYALSGVQEEIETFINKDNIPDIIIISYEGICTLPFVNYFLRNRNKVDGIIMDEGSRVAGFTSLVHKVLREMCKKVDKKFILNATPMVRSPSEILAQMEILRGRDDYSRMVSHYEDGLTKEFKNLYELKEFCSPEIIGFSRDELGLSSEVNQQEVQVNDINDVIYNIASYALANQDKQILIYADKNEIKDAISNAIKAPCVDGRNPKDRDMLLEAFRQKKFKIIISNILRGKDITADTVIFAEVTADWKQVLGRPLRGYQKGQLKVIWLIDDYNKYNRLVKARSPLLCVFNQVDLSPIGGI